MKMSDHRVAWFALSWNDNVLSAYRIAFAGERERDTKQRDFTPKNAIHLFKTHHFPKWKKYDQIPARIWGGRDRRRISSSVHELNVTILESYGILTLINFENILFENIWKKH